MNLKVPAIAAACMMFAGLVGEAQAMPIAPAPSNDGPGVTLVWGGCGPGWHPTRWGGCRPNWGWGRRCWVRMTYWGPRRFCRW
jgi:hypothetical protein